VKYPVSFAHAFKMGEKVSPVFEGIPTQTNVYARYPDGSVQHAQLSCMLDGNPGDAINLNIIEGQSIGGVVSLWPIDVVIEHYNFDWTNKTYSCSAQELIDAGKYKVWITGPFITILVVADHTGAHDASYQTGTYQGGKSFRPVFYITYYHTLNKVSVLVVGENSNTEALQEHAYSLRLKVDGVIKKEKQWMVHWRNSLWSLEYSSVGLPVASIKQSLKYLSYTGALPNYDTSVMPTEASIAAQYSQWQGAPKDLQDKGQWNPAMGAGGAAIGIGPYPIPHVTALYTGDKRMAESAAGNSQLAGSWPIHFRENNPTKKNFGKPLSVVDRPSIHLFDINYGGTKPEDKVKVVGDPDVHGWNPDTAHHPDSYFPLYLTSGHPFWFYELWFSASYCLGFYNGAAINNHCGRGPTGTEGYLSGMRCVQMRGQAWAFRIMCELARFMPDSMAVHKAEAIKHVLDFITVCEGERNINPRNDPLWEWGRNIAFHGEEPPPLHHWDYGNGDFVQVNINPATCSAAISTWEQNFIVYALGRGKELGFPTEKLLSWLSVNIAGQVNSPDYNPYMIGNYRSPTKDINGQPFRTWKDAMTGVDPAYDLRWGFDIGISGGLGAQDGYCKIAMAAVNTTGDAQAIAWMRANVYDKTNWAQTGTRWDILPRVI
jgi:hypothetical protein